MIISKCQRKQANFKQRKKVPLNECLAYTVVGT